MTRPNGSFCGDSANGEFPDHIHQMRDQATTQIRICERPVFIFTDIALRYFVERVLCRHRRLHRSLQSG